MLLFNMVSINPFACAQTNFECLRSDDRRRERANPGHAEDGRWGYRQHLVGGGLVADPGITAYCASKHGVIGLTKGAALEYVSRNIRINAVCPGATKTEMLEDWFQDPAVEQHVIALHPAGRVGAPIEIARTVLFLASDESPFLVGQAIAVDGGMTAQ